MKRCPSCNQVFFDDALSFCTDDGSILEPEEPTSVTSPPPANADPMATMISPSGSIPGYTPPTYAEPPAGSGFGSTPGSSASGSGWGSSQPSGGPMTPDWTNPSATPSWQPPPPPGYGVPVSTPSQGLAIASMIVGLVSITLGWICLGWLEALAAIIMGIIALVMANSDPNRYGGKTFAYVGVATGGLAFLGTILFWIIYAFFVAANSR